MAEEIDRGSSDRQATWVAVKTLRQRPAVVGRTDDGATIYEIRSVRMVLAPGAAHFRRLVLCAKCGRDVPGFPILSPVDLDRPANPVFCDRCAQSPGPPTTEIRREREEPPAPPAPPAPAPAAAAVAAEHAGGLQRLSEQVADLLRGQRAELAKVSASVAEVRAEMRELGESNRALARSQGELDQRIVELESHPGADATAQALHAALAEGLDLLRSEIAALRQRLDDEELAELRASVASAAGAVESLEQRSQDEFAAVAALLEAQRKELTEALHGVAHETLMSVAEPLRDLTKAREDFERRLESLQRKAQEDQRRVEALNASATAGASRLHALEQKLHTSVQRLIHPAGASPDQGEVGPAPAMEGRPPGALLESLERQLREAEERLGQL